jgi:hypothetical protein
MLIKQVYSERLLPFRAAARSALKQTFSVSFSYSTIAYPLATEKASQDIRVSRGSQGIFEGQWTPVFRPSSVRVIFIEEQLGRGS